MPEVARGCAHAHARVSCAVRRASRVACQVSRVALFWLRSGTLAARGSPRAPREGCWCHYTATVIAVAAAAAAAAAADDPRVLLLLLLLLLLHQVLNI